MSSNQIIFVFIFVIFVIVLSYQLGKFNQGKEVARDLIEKLIEQRQVIRSLKRSSIELSFYSWHTTSCVLRSPHASPDDVCDCGWEQAMITYHALMEDQTNGAEDVKDRS